MPSLAIVEDLDILRDLLPRQLTRYIPPMMYRFILQRPPNIVHWRIVVAVTLCAGLAATLVVTLDTWAAPSHRIIVG